MNKTLSILIVAALVTAGGCADFAGQKSKSQIKEGWSRTRATVLASLARDQYEAGNTEKSRITVNEAMKLDNTNASLRVLSAKLYIEAGQLESAEKELNRAAAGDPKMAEVDYLQGVVAQRWQRPQQALEHYNAAAEKNPQELAYVLAQSEAMVLMDKPGDALTFLQAKMADFENSAPLRDAAGQLLLQQKKYDEAAELLRQASVLASDDPTIREHYASALYYNKKYEQCNGVLNRLVRDPILAHRSDLLLMQGRCLMTLGRNREARTCFETAIRNGATQANAYFDLARVSLEIGDIERADSSLQKVLILDPTTPQLDLMLGYTRLKQERFQHAVEYFKRAAAADPKDATAECMLGLALEKQGNKSEAAKHYTRALQINPTDDLAKQLMAGIE